MTKLWALMGAAVCLNPALSLAETNWTGPCAGVFLGHGSTSLKDGENPNYNKLSPKASGFQGGVEAGAGIIIHKPLYLGAKLSYAFAGGSWKASEGDREFNLKNRGTIDLAVQAGAAIDKFLPFAEIGWSQVSATFKGGDANNSMNFLKKTSGLMWGVGAGMQPASKIVVTLGFRQRSHNAKLKMLDAPKVKLTNNTVRLGVSYLFNI